MGIKADMNTGEGPLVRRIGAELTASSSSCRSGRREFTSQASQPMPPPPGAKRTADHPHLYPRGFVNAAGWAAVAALLLVASCDPGPERAKRIAIDTLDRTVEAIAPDLAILDRGGPEQVGPCVPFPGWPGRKYRFEFHSVHELPVGEHVHDRIARLVSWWEAEGGTVSYHRPMEDRATARIAIPGSQEVHASAIEASRQLSIRVRSRCVEP
jgi:hypothetical protein